MQVHLRQHPHNFWSRVSLPVRAPPRPRHVQQPRVLQPPRVAVGAQVHVVLRRAVLPVLRRPVIISPRIVRQLQRRPPLEQLPVRDEICILGQPIIVAVVEQAEVVRKNSLDFSDHRVRVKMMLHAAARRAYSIHFIYILVQAVQGQVVLHPVPFAQRVVVSL